jgi:hypothetical protein
MRWTRQRQRAVVVAGRSFGPVSDQQARRRTMLLRTAKSCGPDAPTLASSLVEASRGPTGPGSPSICEATVAKEPGHRGARKKPLKPLRRESRFGPVNLWCLPTCFLPLHVGPRVHRTPGFPCALFLQGGTKYRHNPGAARRGNEYAYAPSCLKNRATNGVTRFAGALCNIHHGRIESGAVTVYVRRN